MFKYDNKNKVQFTVPNVRSAFPVFLAVLQIGKRPQVCKWATSIRQDDFFVLLRVRLRPKFSNTNSHRVMRYASVNQYQFLTMIMKHERVAFPVKKAYIKVRVWRLGQSLFLSCPPHRTGKIPLHHSWETPENPFPDNLNA